MLYILMSYVLCISLCFMYLVFESVCDKFPFGHNKVEVEAEVNIKTTDGSDIVNLHHNH